MKDVNRPLCPPKGQIESIAVTHGLGGHRLVMFPLCRRLRSVGFSVRNWGYPSFRRQIRHHAEGFTAQLRQLDADQSVPAFHVVAHSMGNILARVALADFQPEKLRRIVMLCPPNGGSRVARFCAPWIGWLSKTVPELADTPDSFVNTLTHQIDGRYQVGILQAANDLMVPPQNTRLPEAIAYKVLPGFHTSILWRRETAKQVSSFLRTGSFDGLDPN